MAARLVLLALAALAFAAPAARADTYKWVDERGVVNYSSHPPADPKQAKVAQKIDDRLMSSVPPDAATQLGVANRGPSYYEQQLERDWAQRQRLMAATNASRVPACAGAYSTDCYYDDSRFAGYAWPVLVTRPVRPVAFRPLSRPLRPLTLH